MKIIFQLPDVGSNQIAFFVESLPCHHLKLEIWVQISFQPRIPLVKCKQEIEFVMFAKE